MAKKAATPTTVTLKHLAAAIAEDPILTKRQKDTLLDVYQSFVGSAGTAAGPTSTTVEPTPARTPTPARKAKPATRTATGVRRQGDLGFGGFIEGGKGAVVKREGPALGRMADRSGGAWRGWICRMDYP